MLKGFENMKIIKAKPHAESSTVIKQHKCYVYRFGLEFICEINEDEESLANSICPMLKRTDLNLYNKCRNKFNNAFEKALKEFILNNS